MYSDLVGDNLVKYKKNIAYLAPEIPALSATFVYQEILQLEKLNISIKPVSIHRPINKAKSDILDKLESGTFYLYEQAFLKVIILNIVLFVLSPIKYFSVFRMAFSDALSVGITTHIGKGLMYRFIIAAGFVKFLRKNNIVHIHSNFAHIPTDIAMYAAALHGVTFSFNSHANDLFERGWLLKEKVSRAKFVATISEYNKRFLIKKGADKNKINIVHCGVNTESFSDRGCKELGMPPVLGTLGRMVEKKGFDVLISSCNLLKKDGVNFKLQIAGDGPLLDNLNELASELDLSENIEFIGAIPHAKVSGWLKSLDIFILACKEDSQGDMDGIPVVLMEAMLSGVPVISSYVSGIPELVIDGGTGFLCAQNDSICLKQKITKLLSSEKLRNNICRHAMSTVKSDFELNKNVKKLSMLFQGVNSDS